LLPQEIKELPGDEELIFYEGCKPIRARKNWFFKDKMFKERAGVAPVVVRAEAAVPSHSSDVTASGDSKGSNPFAETPRRALAA
jgi:type IV secretion system protein VirD4